MTDVYYHWKCIDCNKTWKAGVQGVEGEPDSGWYVHELMTQHNVDVIKGAIPKEG